MKHRNLILLAFLFAFTAMSLPSVAQEEKFVIEINKRLDKGDCENAQKLYEIYKKWTGKTDRDVERRMEECGTPAGRAEERNAVVADNNGGGRNNNQVKPVSQVVHDTIYRSCSEVNPAEEDCKCEYVGYRDYRGVIHYIKYR